MLGSMLGIGYVMVSEAFNDKIDGVGTLQQFPYPVLAVIPDFSDFIKKEYNGNATTELDGWQLNTTMVTILNTISALSESFRRLQSNIIYSNPDRTLNSLVVTSATKGEGKTTVVANLGVVLAEAGYEVVIVDADLRRPKLHAQFGLSRSPGMVETLFENLTLDEALQETPLNNLSLLSAGSEPPNPSAITQSDSFLQTVDQLKQSFDFVLLDTPPYGIITDATPLLRQTDGAVAVSRFNQTTEAELTHLLGNLNDVNVHITGTILTAFDYTQTSDSFYSTDHYRSVYEDYESYEKAE